MDSHEILERINQASLKFLSPLTLEETYKTTVHEAMTLVDAEYGTILFEIDGEFQRVYSSSELAYHTDSRSRGNTYKAYTEEKVILADISETEKHHPELKKFGVKTSVFIPLSYQEKTIGVLVVHAKKKLTVSNDELKLLKLFGSLASLAIRKIQALDEAKRALEVRDMFISLASHELRTPLTSINGYIQLLHSKIGKGETSEAKWVRELYEESGRLTNLVKELLEVNRIKQGQLQFILRECSVSEVLTHAIERCRSAYPDREFLFEKKISEGKDVVIGDFDKLLQVISALLGNAIKFSPPQTEIKIELSSKNKFVTIHVYDKGKGITRDDMGKIFEGFYKGGENYQEGMGVGLLLAKHIINYHHGQISVNSEINQGTLVEVKLPQASL